MYKRIYDCIKAIICVEGTIGAGKSTFIATIAEQCCEYQGYKVLYIQEPVDLWKSPPKIAKEWHEVLPANWKNATAIAPYLESFYANMQAWSFYFQVYVTTTRVKAIENAIRAAGVDQQYLIVCERSLYNDKMVFTRSLVAQDKFDPQLLPMYDQYYYMITNPINELVRVHIVLDVPAQQCLQRIYARNRHGENVISITYLEELKAREVEMYHLLSQKDRVQVVHVDWSQNNATYSTTVANTLNEALEYAITL